MKEKKKNKSEVLEAVLTLLDKAVDEDSLTSYILITRTSPTDSIAAANGTLFSQAVSLVNARENADYRRIEDLAHTIEDELKKFKNERDSI